MMRMPNQDGNDCSDNDDSPTPLGHHSCADNSHMVEATDIYDLWAGWATMESQQVVRRNKGELLQVAGSAHCKVDPVVTLAF